MSSSIELTGVQLPVMPVLHNRIYRDRAVPESLRCVQQALLCSVMLLALPEAIHPLSIHRSSPSDLTIPATQEHHAKATTPWGLTAQCCSPCNGSVERVALKTRSVHKPINHRFTEQRLQCVGPDSWPFDINRGLIALEAFVAD